MQKLVIDCRMPGLNKIFNTAKGGMYMGNKLKREWTERVAWECKAQNIGKIKEPASFQFIFYEPNRRRDPDNFTSGGRKLILDGLQEAGCLENDGWSNITEWSDNWAVDKDNPRIEVLINGKNN